MVFMRLSYLLFSLFVSFSSALGFDIIHYRSKLSLTLLQHGISSFIHMSRDKSIENYENALNDVIDLKEWNNTNIDELFQNIHHDLNQRIKRINLLKNKKIDLEALARSLGFIGLGFGLNYGAFYFHANYYQANRNEYANIKKYLESNGVTVKDVGDIYLTVPPRTFYYKEGKQLLDLNEAADNINDVRVMGFAFAFAAYFKGILEIVAALNPHANDKYLEKYKDMLTIIIKLRKQYSTKK